MSGVVRHYGPAVGLPGGIAAVVESYAGLDLKGWEVEPVTTWHPDARLFSARPATTAALRMVDARLRGVNLAIVHVHLSAGGSFVREGTVLALARTLRIPTVASLHGSRFSRFVREHPRLVRSVLQHADVVCPLGPSTAALVTPMLERTDTQVRILPNPVAVPASHRSAATCDATVLFAGEVGTRKGVDVLLASWPAVRRAHPGAQLLIAGPTGDVVGHAPVEGVRFLGPLPRTEIHTLLEACRVAVLPSRAEVMPMFLLEAMARGRPVVSTDIAEIPWMVGEGGCIVPPDDAAALSRAITGILEDPADAERLGDAARARVERKFSERSSAARLCQLYESLSPRANR